MALGRIAGLVLILSASAAPAFAAPPVLAAHRAVYDLTLLKSSERSGISGANGRMIFELNGSACEGYTVNFRAVTEFQTAETSRLTDQQVATFEDPKNALFTFVTKSFVDKELDKEVRGTARSDGDGVKVELEKPEPGEVKLTPAMFPEAHMIDLLERARRGERFYETAMYDGTEDADKTMVTTVVIGEKRKPAAGDEELGAAGTLAKEEFWPVSIAYYNNANPQDDATPIYRIDFKLYENGISRSFITDYGDFQLRGRLVKLDLLDTPSCQ